jgi:DnaK suppressor protein
LDAPPLYREAHRNHALSLIFHDDFSHQDDRHFLAGRLEEEMPVDLNLMRAQLERERMHLIEQLAQLEAGKNTAEEKRESTPFGKRDQGATETLELEKRLTMEKRIGEQLGEIDHALEKIEKGEYGLCERCGLPIDPARLEAMPTATLCMICKAQPRPR